MEIRRLGFVTVVQNVKPDMDQRLVVPLIRSGNGSPAASPKIPVFPD